MKTKIIFCLNFLKKGEEFDDVLIVCQLAYGQKNTVCALCSLQMKKKQKIIDKI